MDKRDLAGIVRQRLALLLARSGASQSAFARSIGIDRSALSQLLAGAAPRLPRAETLVALAQQHKVSLDWLLGISHDEGLAGEIRESLEIEEGRGAFDRTLLARWHGEAAGSKIRYVPAGIPDLLRTDALIDYEAGIARRDAESQHGEAQYRIDYNRRPETDMEVCMPRHTLEIFARGLGVWSGFAPERRAAQLVHMARLLDDLYPGFRLYLYDGRRRYSVPYTIFGQIRAAIYMGDMYVVLNAAEPVRRLTRHFDNLIRAADVNAHEAAGFARSLADNGGSAD